MIHKYLYIGQDITFDVVIKIEKIVNIICEKENSEFEEVLMKIYKSNTYKNLKKDQFILRTESSEVILMELFREWHKEYY